MSVRRRSQSVRPIVALSIAGAVAVFGALLVPMSAQATPITLSGTAKGPTGVALAGIAVEVDSLSGGVPVQVAATTASSAGAFSFATLADGTYTLRFAASATTYPQYLGETSDLTEAQTITLASGGGNHSYIQATLAGSATIAGTVKTTTGGALKSYTVRAYADSDDASAPIRTAVTSTTGTYSLAGLEPGAYRLEAVDAGVAAPAYGPTFSSVSGSSGTSSIAGATAIGATAGQTTSYAFVLGKAGTVSGRVTGLTGTGSENLAGVTVIPYALQGTSPTFTSASATGATPASTRPDGTYTLGNLAPGYYALEFVPRTTTPLPPSGTIYGRTFLGGTGSAITATPIHVVNATAATANIQLAAGESISGQLVDGGQWPTLVPVPNVRVTVDHDGAAPDQPSHDAQSVISDDQGHFSFSGLGTGMWQLFIGTNTDSDPTDGIAEDTSWQRQDYTYGQPFTVGGSDFERIALDKKDPAGLNPSAQPPSIVSFGSLSVGAELAANAGIWNASIDSYTYQWLRNGKPIAGATIGSYALQAGDVGQIITVRVTAHSLAYGDASAVSDPAGTITPGVIQEFGSPFEQGDPAVGSVLTLVSDGWNVGGIVFSYQWQLSADKSTWTDIPGATGITHTVTDSDLTNGPFLRVKLHGAREGYGDFDAVTSADQAHVGNFSEITPPKLTSTSTKWSDSPGSWSPSIGATTTTWSVFDADGTQHMTIGTSFSKSGTSGKLVTVFPVRSAGGMNDAADAVTVVQKGSAPKVVTAPVLAGTPRVGTPLTSSAPTFVLGSVTVAKQWQYRSGSTWKSIAGATSSSYTPTTTDLGRVLRVLFTASAFGYATASTATAPTAAVKASAAPVQVVAPTVSGTAGTNLTMTAMPGQWSTLVTPKYQWEYSSTGAAPYTKISGATSASYTIPQSLKGRMLVVVVTIVAAGQTPAVVVVPAGVVTASHLTQTRAPKVTRSGSVLKASGVEFSPAATGVTYTWEVYDQTDTNLVLESTGSSWTVPSSLAHDHIVVQATGTRAGYTATDGPLSLAKKGDLVPSASVTLAGGPVGSAITVALPAWNVTSVTAKYAWEYKSGSTWKTISSAKSSAYTPSSTYLARQVRAVVTASHGNYTPGVFASTAVTISPGLAPIPGTGAAAPGINGYNAIGSTQTAFPGSWSVSGLKFAYQWQLSPDGSSWTNVPGAKSAGFVIPDSAWQSQNIGVVITATRAGYATGSTRITTIGPPVDGPFAVKVAAKVVTSRTGSLTVAAPTWAPVPTSVQYEWDVYDPATDVPTVVGTTATYVPVAADVGKEITVTTTPVKTHYNSVPQVTVAQRGATIAPGSPITVTGTAVVGNDLTVNWNEWSTANPFVRVQWYRGGKAITGAVNATYTLATADLGAVISVTVTADKDGYASGVVTVVAGTPLSDTPITSTVPPSITGTMSVDGALGADPGTWTVPGVTFRYQWFRDNQAIPGATTAKYLPTAPDEGSDISFEIYVTKAGYLPAQAVALPISIGAGAPLQNLAAVPVKITGTVGLGKPLGATVGGWNFSPTVTWQWEYLAPGTPGYVPVVGATSNSFTPTAAQGVVSGGRIRLTIVATRAGHAQATETSAPVTVP